MAEAKLILDVKAAHGESPYWCEKEKRLYWLDILNQNVHIFNPSNRADEIIHLPVLATTLVEMTGGGFLVSGIDGIYSFNHDFNDMHKVLCLEQNNPVTRFNDGKADASGRLWVGSMHMEGKPGYGSLYCVDQNYAVERKLNNVDISNGIVWTSDRTLMYYTHTLSGEILCFDYNNDTGRITNQQTVFEFCDQYPDGMAIDACNNLWIAIWGESKVVCLDTASRCITQIVDVQAPLVSAVAFGGENLQTLYITTSRLGLTDADLQKYPQSGGLFSYETNIKGTLFNKFFN